jgi:tRNA (cmo5U34)-methyltransferase
MPDSSFAIPQTWTFRDTGVAAGFDRHVREQLPWYDLATGAVAHVARHYLAQGGTVYDIGAATGNIGRALSTALDARNARLIPVEPSQEMAQAYEGPQRHNLIVQPAEKVAFEPFDVAILFLTLMFVPPMERPMLLADLHAQCKLGGAIVVFDKREADTGYAATVVWRLALAGKVATGVDPAEIVAKELSLSGVQRPINPEQLGLAGGRVLEFFRFGEFSGWLIEP